MEHKSEKEGGQAVENYTEEVGIINEINENYSVNQHFTSRLWGVKY